MVTTMGIRFPPELYPLRNAYERMSAAFEGAIDSAGRLDILRAIYDGFFKAAMPDAVSRLGIVYPPIEIVDFMLRSADAVCRQEFGVGLTHERVNVLDPFCGTGTFLARLLTIKGSDGQPLIRDEDVARKYRHELHANEIVLLAYYIAALKLEEAAEARGAFSDREYEPFPGAVLADTFLMGDEQRNKQLGLDPYMRENSERAPKAERITHPSDC